MRYMASICNHSARRAVENALTPSEKCLCPGEFILTIQTSCLLALLMLGSPQFQIDRRLTTPAQVKAEGRQYSPPIRKDVIIGKTVDEAQNGVVWGETVMGAQAGIRIEGVIREFVTGEHIPLAIFLSNTTNHKLAIIYALKEPLIWNHDGSPLLNTQTHMTATGLPGATLIILSPGETLWETSRFLISGGQLKPGKYSIGAAFLYGVPADERLHLGDVRRRKEFPGFADAQKRMNNNALKYRTWTNMRMVINRSKRAYEIRALTVGADAFMTWSLMGTPCPPLSAIEDDSFIWTQTVKFEVVTSDDSVAQGH